MNGESSKAKSSNGSGLSRMREWLRNPISLAGLALAVVAFGNFLFLFFIDLTSEHPSPYVGILAYMVAPGFLVGGLLLAGFGVWYDRRKRRRRPADAGRYMRIDFNDPSQRGALAFLFTFIIGFIGLSVVGSAIPSWLPNSRRTSSLRTRVSPAWIATWGRARPGM